MLKVTDGTYRLSFVSGVESFNPTNAISFAKEMGLDCQRLTVQTETGVVLSLDCWGNLVCSNNNNFSALWGKAEEL